MKRGVWLLLVVCVTWPADSAGKECRGLPKGQTPFLENLLTVVSQSASEAASCGSLGSVFSQLSRSYRKGGRQLEPERPLNVQEAQAELQAASRQPAVRAQLEQVAREAGSDDLRLMYEAAVLDQHGFYKARDLKVQELMRRGQ